MRLMPVVAFGGSSGIRGHAVRLLHQHGPWHLLSEGVFVMLVPLRIRPA